MGQIKYICRPKLGDKTALLDYHNYLLEQPSGLDESGKRHAVYRMVNRHILYSARQIF